MYFKKLQFCIVFSFLFTSISCVSADELKAGFVDALNAVVKYHPAIRGKQAEVEAKHFAIDSAKAGRYPNFSAELSYDNEKKSKSTVRLQQPIWAFGKIDRKVDSAVVDRDAELANKIKIKRDLLEKTALAYVKIEGLRIKQNVNKESVAELQSLTKQIERRKKGSLASGADVALASSRLIQAVSKSSRYDGELNVAKDELRALTQIEISSLKPVDTTFLELVNFAEDELSKKIETDNALLNFKQKQLLLAEKVKKVKQVNYYPTLSLRLDYTDNEIIKEETKGLIVLESTLNGFGFATRAEEQISTARISAARYDLESSKNEIKRQLNTLLSNKKLYLAIKMASSKSVKALTKIVQSYKRQYDAGRKSWLELLNLQRELTEQRQSLVDATTNVVTYDIKIISLIGGLDRFVNND